MKKTHNSDKLSALGPYSHGVAAQGETVYLSGQLGINHRTKEMGADINAQTRFALENVQLLLSELGLEMKDVVKTLVLLKDIADFQEMNQVYSEFFTEEAPARSAFQVGALPNNGLVEIEVIAVR
ncbi:RidA family protein [Enterococcus sp. LJL128]|uniref:RidA family protein n=1 Tax=Enterococcus sp. LJL51 TaxID=3416656 RepID=UPI003CF8319D